MEWYDCTVIYFGLCLFFSHKNIFLKVFFFQWMNSWKEISSLTWSQQNIVAVITFWRRTRFWKFSVFEMKTKNCRKCFSFHRKRPQNLAVVALKAVFSDIAVSRDTAWHWHKLQMETWSLSRQTAGAACAHFLVFFSWKFQQRSTTVMESLSGRKTHDDANAVFAFVNLIRDKKYVHCWCSFVCRWLQYMYCHSYGMYTCSMF